MSIQRKHKLLIFLMTMMIMVWTSMSMLQVYASNNEEGQWIEIQVEKGDTLWKLVSEYYEGDRDIRAVIYDVKKINGLRSSTITPRQQIKIPIK